MTIINAQLGGDRHEDLTHSKLWSWHSDRIEIHLVLNFHSEGSISFGLERSQPSDIERCDVPMRPGGNLKQLFKERIKAFRQLCTPGQAGSTMVPTVRVTTARTLMELLAA